MKAREKLLIVVSLLACGISIAIFAVVSLGHFIYTPDRTRIPIVGKMYESTVDYVSVLTPLPVAEVTAPSTNQNANNAAQPALVTQDLQVDDKKLLKKQRIDDRRASKSKLEANSQLDYDGFRKAINNLLRLLQ